MPGAGAKFFPVKYVYHISLNTQTKKAAALNRGAKGHFVNLFVQDFMKREFLNSQQEYLYKGRASLEKHKLWNSGTESQRHETRVLYKCKLEYEKSKATGSLMHIQNYILGP